MYQSLNKEIQDVTKVHPTLLSEAKENTAYSDNSVDRGIINKKNGSSILIRENGDISISPSISAQQKFTASGHAIEQSIESNTITVRKNLNVDEIIINDHKFNPALYELSDMRKLFNSDSNAIGNLTLNTTVLVKAWEPTLKKWVLIRRPARMPMFSPILNLQDCPDQLSINSDISQEILMASAGGKRENG